MPYLPDCVLLSLVCPSCLFCSVAYPCLILCRSYWLLLLHYYYGYYSCILLHCVSSCVLRSLFIVHPFTHTYTHADTPPPPGTPTPLRSLSIHIITTHTPLIHKNNSQNSMVKNEKSFCKNSLLTIKQLYPPHPKKCYEKSCKVPSPYPRILKGFACKVPSGYIKKIGGPFWGPPNRNKTCMRNRYCEYRTRVGYRNFLFAVSSTASASSPICVLLSTLPPSIITKYLYDFAIRSRVIWLISQSFL